MTQALAEVYMVTGENAKAIELLDGLLSRPGDLTVAFLKLDPSRGSIARRSGIPEGARETRIKDLALLLSAIVCA